MYKTLCNLLVRLSACHTLLTCRVLFHQYRSSLIALAVLQYVYRLVPRGQYTSGKGSSAVGLTASVARDPDTRHLVLQTGILDSIKELKCFSKNLLISSLL